MYQKRDFFKLATSINTVIVQHSLQSDCALHFLPRVNKCVHKVVLAPKKQ